MAQAEVLVYSTLASAATVTAITTRIYPVLLPEHAAFPCLTYQRISGDRIYSLTAYAELQHNRIQIDTWSTSYSQTKALSNAVINVMEGAASFKSVLVGGQTDIYDDEFGIYRVSMDFSIWHA